MGTPPANIGIKVNPKVSIGFGTVAGVLAAVAQYLGAVGLMLAGGDLTTESIGALATATLTLVTVLIGRFKQADSAIQAISAERVANPSVLVPAATLESSTEPETNVLYLDGKAIAEAVVRSLNTAALVNAMRAGTDEQKKSAEPPASTTTAEEA